jgi:hypothetical protein
VTVGGQRDATAVDGNRCRTQHATDVVRSFALRQNAIGIAVDQRRDPRGDVGARRQVDLDVKTFALDPDARGLQILVEPMRRHWRRRAGDECQHAEQDRQEPVHFAASLAP